MPTVWSGDQSPIDLHCCRSGRRTPRRSRFDPSDVGKRTRANAIASCLNPTRDSVVADPPPASTLRELRSLKIPARIARITVFELSCTRLATCWTVRTCHSSTITPFVARPLGLDAAADSSS